MSRRPRASGYFRTDYGQDLALIQTRLERVALAMLAVTLVALPAFASPFLIDLATQTFLAVIGALALMLLTGYAGQVSLGHAGLLAAGAFTVGILAKELHAAFFVTLPAAAAIGALLGVLFGLPSLRVRGLYLAVSTLGFALFMQEAVLATPCETVPVIGKRICTGLPDPQSTLISRPTLFGLSLGSERAFAWFSLAILILSVLMVRVWRDRGVARRLVSVRDNEVAAGATGIPVVRTKLLAFALSGFMAGYAGVCFAFASERFSASTFDPGVSILVISMVVIGGLGSISGAVLGAVYLVGLPAIFGTTSTIQFITSGFGLLAFILYLPGGLAEILHRLGDLATAGLVRLREGPPSPETAAPSDEPPPLKPDELVEEVVG